MILATCISASLYSHPLQAPRAAAAEDQEASEAAGLEAASALAAVGALVEGLKAFLSPHLAALLQLLFSPRLLACKQAGCSEAAATIRIQLAAVIPPRLLLAPLFSYWDGALQASLGSPPVCLSFLGQRPCLCHSCLATAVGFV